VTGKEIDRAMAPDGFNRNEMAGLHDDVMADVTSLPGMSFQGDDRQGQRDESESAVANALLASATGNKKKGIVEDPFWARPTRHGLRSVKDQDTLFETVTEVAGAEDWNLSWQCRRCRIQEGK